MSKSLSRGSDTPGSDDIPLIVATSRGSSMQTNPIVLVDGEIAEILLRRL